MSNSLIYKTQQTLIKNDVYNDLKNNEIDYVYTGDMAQSIPVIPTATLNLTSPTSLPTTIPFIELISDYPIDLIFKDYNGNTITSLKSINYLSGNIKGYDFSIINNSTSTANIKWSIYY